MKDGTINDADDIINLLILNDKISSEIPLVNTVPMIAPPAKQKKKTSQS